MGVSSVRRAAVGSSDNHARYLFENFNFGLRLCSAVGVVPPSVDEGLKMLAVLHLCLVLFPKVTVAFCLGGVELCEVSGM